MRFLLANHIQNAYQSLRSSKTRSGLTMLGVTIGIASITAILALSGGASKLIDDQVEVLGGNIAIIRPGATEGPVTSITNINSHRDFAASTLTESDVVYAKNTKHVQSAAPLMILSGRVKADSIAPTNSPIVASTPELASISNLQVREGQFLDSSIKQNTAVVGTQLSIDIFGTESSIGKTVHIRGKPFTVVGVLKTQNDPINYNQVDFDNSVIINFASGKSLNHSVVQIQQINIQADSITNLNDIIKHLDQTLTASHKGEQDFSILSGDQIAQPTSQLFYTIAAVTTAIAAISLLVGGIGIMNIMLVTVVERTREIGIRKALGASNSDISWQFLIESLAISIGGGIAGYVSGYVVAFGISTFLTFNPIINWQIAAIAMAVSVIMGTVFGIYPALRASRKNPIESLRQYS